MIAEVHDTLPGCIEAATKRTAKDEYSNVRNFPVATGVYQACLDKAGRHFEHSV